MATPAPGSILKKLEAALLPDSRPQFLELDTGIVLYSVPGLNAYYVIPSQNVGGAGSPMIEVAFATNGPCVKYGASVAESYQPGTMVVLARTGTAVKPGQAEASRMTLLMCSVPRDAITDVKPYQSRHLAPQAGLDYFTTPFASSAFVTPGLASSPLLQDRNYGRPIEMLAGDWAVTSDFLCHAWVGHSYASFGSLRARIEAHAVHDRLRLTADDLRMDGVGLETASRPDLAELVHYECRARSILEGMGSIKGPPVKKDDKGRWQTLFPDQQGIFRHERYEGELVDGIWDAMQVPETVASVRRRSVDGQPPFGVGSEQAMYEGTWERRAARQLALVKSAYIPVPRSLVREDDTKEFPDENEGTSWQQTQGISEDDYPNLAPANGADEFDHNTAGWWRKRMRARTENWKVSTPQEVGGAYGIDMEARRKIDPLPDTSQDYKLPPVVELTDPSTGRKTLYYAAESFIRLMPDGSISIGDGYGAEIRFARGRMVLSAPADIEIRPGRDLVQMAPRHLVANAGADVQLQSARGSVYLKAEENLNALAGNSGKGLLLLESRGTAAVEGGSTTALGSGVVVKSAADLAMVGGNMYLGVYDKGDSGTSGLKRTKGGAILIDSCGGMLGLMGGTFYGTFKTSAATVAGDSAMALGAGAVTLLGATVGIGTTSLSIGVPKGSATVRSLGPSGVASRSLSISGRLRVGVAGILTVRDNLTAGASVQARYIRAADGRFANATMDSGCSGGAPKIQIDLPAVSFGSLGSAGDAFRERVLAATPALYTGAGLLGAGFGYPTSFDLGVAESYRIYAARWQKMVQNAPVWREKAVINPDGDETYVYPGKERWDAATFFMGVPTGSILKDSYQVNTTR